MDWNFIDGAFCTEDGLALPASRAAAASNKNKSKANSRTTAPTATMAVTPTADAVPAASPSLSSIMKGKFAKSRSARGTAARQVPAASGEHASVVESLRKELGASQVREKALVAEFTVKLREMHQQANPSAFKPDIMPFDDEDMPMDEMADTARMERCVRTMEHIEQRRTLEEFKRHSDLEMAQLRKQNEDQARKINNALKEKAAAIQQLNDSLHTPGKSLQQMPASPLTESPPATRKNSTPMHRLRAAQKNQHVSTPPTHETIPSNMTMDSTIADAGGPTVIDSHLEENPSPKPASRLDSLFQTMLNPNLHSLHNLLRAVENVITGNADEDEIMNANEQSVDLSEGEKEFVDNIRSIFESSQQEHVEIIESLKNELEETNKALQEGESEMMTMLESKQRKIKDLEKELTTAKESATNVSSLEGMLRMVADDQKSSVIEYTDLKKKLRNIEQERDELVAEKYESQHENEEAIAAMRRVMADATAEKEKALEELANLNSISAENALLKKKLDPSYDALSDVTVNVEGSELAKLRKDAMKCNELEERAAYAVDQLEEVKAMNDELERLVEESKEKFKNLEDAQALAVTHTKAATDEMASLEIIEDLQKENAVLEETIVSMEAATKKEGESLRLQIEKIVAEVVELKNELKKSQSEKEKLLPFIVQAENTIGALLEEKDELEERYKSLESEAETLKLQASTAEQVLETAKGVHAREHKLEEELSGLSGLLDSAMAEKHKIKEYLASKTEEMKTQNGKLESKLQNLQMEVIEMKEEKMALKTQVREAENALVRSNRIMSLMQETADTEGTASHAIMDLKDQLREQQDLHAKLRYCCDENASFMIDKLNAKVHTTLCLLETGVLCISSDLSAKSIAQFDFSSNTSPKEQLLESSLNIQRAQNDRISKSIEELRTEKDQETAILGMELASLQGKYELEIAVLAKKEEELEILRASLKEATVGYISDDDSDSDDDDGDTMTKVCADLKNAKENAERVAKENAESLANAKMIISSLEESNKTSAENLRSRLHDSNAAIVSLLEQTSKHEKEAEELKRELQKTKDDLESQKDEAESPSSAVEDAPPAVSDEKKEMHSCDAESPSAAVEDVPPAVSDEKKETHSCD